MGIAAALVCAYGLLQKLGYDPVTWSQSSADRVFSTIGNPNMLAAYCVALMPFLLLNGWREQRWGWRWMFWGTSVALLVVLFLTQCRGALIGLAASVVVGAWLFRGELKGLRQHRRKVALAGVVLIVVIGFLAKPMTGRWWRWRRTTTLVVR